MSRPKVIELKEAPKVRVLGQFRCTGEGNMTQFKSAPCGSLLEITSDTVYKTTHHSLDFSIEHFSTFMCPVCGYETDFPLPADVHMYQLPLKKDYLNKVVSS